MTDDPKSPFTRAITALAEVCKAAKAQRDAMVATGAITRKDADKQVVTGEVECQCGGTITFRHAGPRAIAMRCAQCGIEGIG